MTPLVLHFSRSFAALAVSFFADFSALASAFDCFVPNTTPELATSGVAVTGIASDELAITATRTATSTRYPDRIIGLSFVVSSMCRGRVLRQVYSHRLARYTGDRSPTSGWRPRCLSAYDVVRKRRSGPGGRGDT